jgi:extracellular matrix regulatory protein B
MYIHIGGENSVSDKYIVGIFDLDNTTVQPSDTIEFLARAEQNGRLEVVSPEIPRSFVVTLDRIYVTPISPGTLRRRLIRPDGIASLAGRQQQTSLTQKTSLGTGKQNKTGPTPQDCH